jgi:hypothetical protein
MRMQRGERPIKSRRGKKKTVSPTDGTITIMMYQLFMVCLFVGLCGRSNYYLESNIYQLKMYFYSCSSNIFVVKIFSIFIFYWRHDIQFRRFVKELETEGPNICHWILQSKMVWPSKEVRTSSALGLHLTTAYLHFLLKDSCQFFYAIVVIFLFDLNH